MLCALGQVLGSAEVSYTGISMSKSRSSAGRAGSASMARPARAGVATAQPVDAKTRSSAPDDFFRVWLPTLVVAIFIITFVAQPFDIPSSSMEQTLLVGDHLLADRVRLAPPAHWAQGVLPYRPLQHGDIAIFMSVVQPDLHLVKRVIGLPGDRIKLVHGVVYRNGVALHEPYAEHSGDYEAARDDWPNGGTLPGAWPQWAAEMPQYVVDGAIQVPADSYFMMGDNRDDSFDSRFFGFVPANYVLGRPSIVYWSYRSTEADYTATGLGDRIGSFVSTLLHAPTRTRWSRTLHIPR